MKKAYITGAALCLIAGLASADTVKYETFFIKTGGESGRFYTQYIDPTDGHESTYSDAGGSYTKEYQNIELKKGDKLHVRHYRYEGDARGLSGCKIYLNGEAIKQDTGINKSECRYTVN